jgi:neutral ceramidase
VNQVGDSLARRGIALFESLGGSVSPDLTIGVAFRTLNMRGDSAALGICGKPQVGTSTTGGADDGRSRFYKWKFLGLFPLGMEEGGSAINTDPSGCQREKQTVLNVFTRDHGLPEYAQLAVARIGAMYLGTVPLEPTTMAGAEMQRAIGEAAGLSWPEARRRVAIVALTNGFLQYVTTRQEFAAQAYEGGSTLFGPNESKAVAGQLAELTRGIVQAGGYSPRNEIGPITGYPGKGERVLPRDSLPGPPPDPGPRWISCRGDTLIARWTGMYPIQLRLDSGPTVSIERLVGGAWATAVLDDDRELEVWSVGKGKQGWTYELRWVPGETGGPFRVQVLNRDGTALGAPSAECNGEER